MIFCRFPGEWCAIQNYDGSMKSAMTSGLPASDRTNDINNYRLDVTTLFSLLSMVK